MNRKIRLIWDFHGGDAEKTAQHHVRHLEEFMQREELECLRTTVLSNADYHFMACMTVNEKDVMILRDSLKPHRAVVVEDIND
ncbi:hypothetical protein K6119_19310 [Paracrocinitomix mangrovi]|uniref:hypothetical protein n=1 Tax=Paracrocinitomix mangrovi TaxID=2862509 RepID=UPI001C8D45C4|nr:hypothetical protein [Paracrocinitomix mangrovi]UKN01875.1 hypothetical protein K6119_19310 [Paracrocinitomix mangrovi]